MIQLFLFSCINREVECRCSQQLTRHNHRNAMYNHEQHESNNAQLFNANILTLLKQAFLPLKLIIWFLGIRRSFLHKLKETNRLHRCILLPTIHLTKPATKSSGENPNLEKLRSYQIRSTARAEQMTDQSFFCRESVYSVVECCVSFCFKLVSDIIEYNQAS